jgi:hypothetical protein
MLDWRLFLISMLLDEERIAGSNTDIAAQLNLLGVPQLHSSFI